MRILGLLLLLFSVTSIAKTDYGLTCNYQSDGIDNQEMNFRLYTEETAFQLVHSDFVEIGALTEDENFYHLELFPDNKEKRSKKFRATINKHTGDFTLLYISEHPGYKSLGKNPVPFRGKCLKTETDLDL